MSSTTDTETGDPTGQPTKLKAMWLARKKELRLTQDAVKDEFGYSSQAAISQALNGVTPLTPAQAIKWAEILKCSVSDIWEGNLEEIAELLTGADLYKRALKLSPEDRWELYRRIGDSFDFFGEPPTRQ
ncbi:MAG: helix-turn-helix transcriptional regulator [Pseudomonadota bacterium]